MLGEFVQEHDAYWGWCTAAVTQRLQSVLASVRPDIVLVHLGTNDIGKSTPGQIADSLDNLIAALRAQNPQMRVLIATLASWQTTATSPVVAVDQGSAFAASADTWDCIHPNDSGEAKMAARWHQALPRFW